MKCDWETVSAVNASSPMIILTLCFHPLTLQLLVENVIKHNSITSGKPMRIHIDIENNYLIVSNPIQPKKVMTPHRGVGLNNLSNRCKLMLGEEIIVIKENNSFTVKSTFRI